MLSPHGKGMARICCSSVWHERSQFKVCTHTLDTCIGFCVLGLTCLLTCLLATLATPCLKVSGSVAITEPMTTRYRICFFGEMDAIRIEITDLEATE